MNTFAKLLLFQLLGALLAVLFFAIPSPLSPVLWTDPFPLPPLPAPNTRLAHAIKSAEAEVHGPESLAVDEKGNVFTSIGDGRILLLDPRGQVLHTVYFDAAINKQFKGEFLGADKRVRGGAKAKMQWCTDEAKAQRLQWNRVDEAACGRPLGLRFLRNGRRRRLYFVDAYRGVFRIELSSKSEPMGLEQLVSPETAISAPEGEADATASLPPRFYNDLDVSKDERRLFFSDSSHKHTRAENRAEVLDAAPRGRLFSLDLDRRVLTVLLCGLHFPNGVQLLPGSSHSLLLVESARFRILRVDVDKLAAAPTHLLASCKERGSLRSFLESSTATSAVSVFYDSAPGFMDNIRLAASPDLPTRGFLVGLATKSCKPFSLLYLAYQSVLLRHFIGRIVPLKLVERLVPKYGMVLILSSEGTLVDTLQDPSGRISLISEAAVNPITRELWIGSHSNAFVARLPLEGVLRS